MDSFGERHVKEVFLPCFAGACLVFCLFVAYVTTLSVAQLKDRVIVVN
jgi:hypothetical protein